MKIAREVSHRLD